MTSFALGFHNKLAKSGITPSSPEYYERIDARMKQVFPDVFESEKAETSEDATPSPKNRMLLHQHHVAQRLKDRAYKNAGGTR